MQHCRELASLSDERLLLRFREAHDEAAFALLFQRRAVPLRRAARLLGAAPAEVEDLVQSTFLQALRSVDTFDAARSLRAWLHGILVNQVRMARRHSARRPRPTSPLNDEDATCAPRSLLEETRAGLRDAVASLPSPYREVVSLRFEHGMDTAAIARRLARTEGAVRKQTERGLEMLRRMLPVGLAGGVALWLASAGPRAARRLRPAARPSRAWAAAGLLATLSLGALACAAVWSEAAPSVLAAASQPASTATVPVAAAPARRRIAAPPRSSPRAEAEGARVHVLLPDGTPARHLPVRVLRRDLPLQAAQLRPLAELRSDGEGWLRLPALPVARWALSVDGALPRRHLESDAPVAMTAVDWTVAALRRVSGVVLDADDHPVADAAILVSATGGQGDVGDVVGRSDGCGRFTVTLACEQPHVWASRSGHCASAIQQVEAGDGHSLNLRLGEAGVRLQGRVGCVRRDLQSGLALVGWFPSLQPAARPPVYVLADDDGRFALEDLPPGDGLLVVHHAGLAPAMRPLTLRGDRVDCGAIMLERGVQLDGTVRDETGRPCADLVVRVTAARPAADSSDGGLGALTTTTDRDGRYHVEGVAPGAVHVLAFGGSAWPPRRAHCRLDLFADASCDLIVHATPFVRGRVLSADGTPLSGWRIATLPHDLPLAAFAPFWQGLATTAADGSFRLSCRSRATRVAVFAPAGVGSTWPLLVRDCRSAGDDATVELRVPSVAERAPAVESGKVVAAAATLAELDLRLEHARWPLPQPVTIDAAGRYRLPVLASGPYSLRLQRRGVLGELAVAFEVAAGADRAAPAAPTLVWDEPVRMRLRLQHAGAGEQLEGGTFLLLGDSGQPLARGSVEVGVTRSLLVVPGRYQLVAWSARCAPVRRSLVVSAGCEHEVDVELTAAAPCCVSIDCNDIGSPWLQRGPMAVRVSDGEGRALLYDLLPGTEASLRLGLPAGRDYTVCVVSACGRRCERRFTVDDTGDTSVPLALP
ncbi:MAG: sigma-70 family RNA polymerase sigma factor [Planctomycetota bacterium]